MNRLETQPGGSWRRSAAVALFALTCLALAAAALFQRMGDPAVLYRDLNGSKAARALLALGGVIVLFLSALSIGRGALRLARVERRDALDAIGLGLGAWIAGAFVFIALRAPMALLAAAMLLLGAMAAFLARVASRRGGRGGYRDGNKGDEKEKEEEEEDKDDCGGLEKQPSVGGRAILVCLLTLFLAPALIAALAPPAEWDALVYHLTIPKLYLQRGFCDAPYLLYFHMPQNVHLLFAPLLALLPDCAPQLAHFALGLLCAASIAQTARRVFGPGAGVVAAAIFLGLPVVRVELSAAYIDLGVTFFFLRSLDAWLRWSERKGGAARRGDVIVAGAMMGLALGSKYTAIYGYAAIAAVWLIEALAAPLLSALAAVLAGWKTRPPLPQRRADIPVRQLHGELRDFLLFTAIAAAAIAPWLIKNALMTGNPVYPNLFSLFGGKDWSAEANALMWSWLDSMGMGKHPVDFFKLPWRLAVRGAQSYERFAGVATPWPFAGLLLLLVARRLPRSAWRSLAVAVVFAVCWFCGSQQLRFLLPGLAALCVVSGGLVAAFLARAVRRPGLTPWIAASALALSAPFDMLPWYRVSADLAAAVGQKSRDEYVAADRQVSCHRIVQTINRDLPPNARVLMLFENRGYYLERDYIADGMFECAQVPALIAAAPNAPALRAELRRRGVTHVLCNHAYWNAPVGDYARRQYPDFERKFAELRERYLVELDTLDWVTLYELR